MARSGHCLGTSGTDFCGSGHCECSIGRLAFTRIRVRSSKLHLNRRAESYVGRTFTLERPIVDGRGRLKVDDTVWQVEGPDLPVGTRVRVTGVENTLLRVAQL